MAIYLLNLPPLFWFNEASDAVAESGKYKVHSLVAIFLVNPDSWLVRARRLMLLTLKIWAWPGHRHITNSRWNFRHSTNQQSQSFYLIRPKLPYGRQGQARSWDKDTVRRVTWRTRGPNWPPLVQSLTWWTPGLNQPPLVQKRYVTDRGPQPTSFMWRTRSTVLWNRGCRGQFDILHWILLPFRSSDEIKMRVQYFEAISIHFMSNVWIQAYFPP